MESTRYLIVGGGMTGDAAVKGIREHDADGSIVVVGAEEHAPYARPPLSKKLWAGSDEAKIWRGTEEAGSTLRLGRRIVSLDLDGHRATDDHGDEYHWEKLLLATGGRPRTIPGAEGVIYFRTLDDYRAVRGRVHEGASAIVIGGGFIGSELAAALAATGCRVTMIFPERGIASRILPAELSAYVTDQYREHGVEVLTEETVAAAGATWVKTGDGRTIEADIVVAGLGIEPESDLAQAAGLEVDNGIVVDAFGRASGHEDVFAAGDVASFPIEALGRRFRVEHEDHAKSHGRAAGANMAGANVPYLHLPFFYSDMFDLGYEAVGEVDARLATIESWEEPNRKGIVAYVDEERRPRGFLYWNVWDHVDAGRELIAAGEPIQEAALV
ncbi:MAG TPA: FAD-dependent oxidoreductase [Gaiellaceae bacterium]|nr:FAD-dependent oxidoreductase [Gaiellaceae bacterium]